jgi:hypothetical protein
VVSGSPVAFKGSLAGVTGDALAHQVGTSRRRSCAPRQASGLAGLLAARITSAADVTGEASAEPRARRSGTTGCGRRIRLFYTIVFAGLAVLLVVAVMVQKSHKK